MGPKGSGKSHIGRELENLFRIKYVRIEAIWQKLKEKRTDFLTPEYIQEGRKLTLALIEDNLKSGHVCIEASGVGEDWDQYVSDLRKISDIFFVKIICSLKECRHRATVRDQSLQVQISDEIFEDINNKAQSVELNWSAVINNEPFITIDNLNSIMRPILMKNGFLEI